MRKKSEKKALLATIGVKGLDLKWGLGVFVWLQELSRFKINFDNLVN